MKEILPKNLVKNRYYYIYCRWIDNCKYIKSKPLHNRKLIGKIDSALRKIEDGSYGFCEDTGEPISLSRLEARPIASLSLHAQELHERMERVHRDD